MTEYTSLEDLTVADLAPPDESLMPAEFKEPESNSGEPLKLPGAYPLQLPPTITGRKVQFDTGPGFLEFNLDGLTTATGRFVKAGNFGTTISSRNHYQSSTNDVWDLMINFGAATRAAAPTPQEMLDFFKSAAGQVTPNPVGLEAYASYQDDGCPEGTVAINGKAKGGKARRSEKTGKTYVDVYGSAFKGQPTINVTLSNGTTQTLSARPKVGRRGWLGTSASNDVPF